MYRLYSKLNKLVFLFDSKIHLTLIAKKMGKEHFVDHENSGCRCLPVTCKATPGCHLPAVKAVPFLSWNRLLSVSSFKSKNES